MMVKLIEKHFALLLIIASALGLSYPTFFIRFVAYIPLMFGISMLAMGVILEVRELKEVLHRPEWIITGGVLQYTINPLLAVLICTALPLPPEAALGLIIAASCPNGLSSNIISYLARANLSLSVSLTALNSLLAPLLTPLWVYALAHKHIHISFLDMMGTIFWVVTFPVISGMLIRKLLEKRVNHIIGIFPAASIIVALIVAATIMALNSQQVKAFPVMIILAIILQSGGGFILGYLIARVCSFPATVCRSLSIEIGIHNSALGAILSVTYFNKLVALPATFFNSWCAFAGALFAKSYPNSNKAFEKK